MPKSLLEQLPEIVANGRRQAEKILESLERLVGVQVESGAESFGYGVQGLTFG